MICPADDERGIVFPLERAFEELGSGSVFPSINVAYPLLCRSVVYFHSLGSQSAPQPTPPVLIVVKAGTHQIIRPRNQIPSPFDSPNRPFARMYNLLLVPQPPLFLHDQIPRHATTHESPASLFCESRLERDSVHGAFVIERVAFRTCQ